MKHQQGMQGLKTLHRGNWDCTKEKKDGAGGMAEPACYGRLGKELDGENCEWDEEVCACVCVCMHEHVHTGSPALAEL